MQQDELTADELNGGLDDQDGDDTDADDDSAQVGRHMHHMLPSPARKSPCITPSHHSLTDLLAGHKRWLTLRGFKAWVLGQAWA